MRRLRLFALCFLILGAIPAPIAAAANIIVGSDLNEPQTPVPFGAPTTLVNTSVSGLGAHAVSPVDGLIVAWNLSDNSVGGEYRLRVLTPLGPGSYLFTGSSSGERPTAAYSARFATALPIAAGQAIGLDLSGGASIGHTEPLLGAASISWSSVPGEGPASAPSYSSPENEWAFNAEVRPAPSIADVAPAAGPPAGGTTVTITGADFEEATAVKFGTSPATDYRVESESRITATAPPRAAGPVPVSVTTVAGTGVSAEAFDYEGPATAGPAPVPLAPPVPAAPATCKVPNLKGEKLKASKRVAGAADCKLGKVTMRKGATAKSGKVVGQSPKPGKVLGAGAKVNVTLG